MSTHDDFYPQLTWTEEELRRLISEAVSKAVANERDRLLHCINKAYAHTPNCSETGDLCIYLLTALEEED